MRKRKQKRMRMKRKRQKNKMTESQPSFVLKSALVFCQGEKKS